MWLSSSFARSSFCRVMPLGPTVEVLRLVPSWHALDGLVGLKVWVSVGDVDFLYAVMTRVPVLLPRYISVKKGDRGIHPLISSSMVRRLQFHHWVGKGWIPTILPFIGTHVMRKTDWTLDITVDREPTLTNTSLHFQFHWVIQCRSRKDWPNASTIWSGASLSKRMTKQRKKTTSLEHLSRMAISITYPFSFIPTGTTHTTWRDVRGREVSFPWWWSSILLGVSEMIRSACKWYIYSIKVVFM